MSLTITELDVWFDRLTTLVKDGDRLLMQALEIRKAHPEDFKRIEDRLDEKIEEMAKFFEPLEEKYNQLAEEESDGS